MSLVDSVDGKQCSMSGQLLRTQPSLIERFDKIAALSSRASLNKVALLVPADARSAQFWIEQKLNSELINASHSPHTASGSKSLRKRSEIQPILEQVFWSKRTTMMVIGASDWNNPPKRRAVVCRKSLNASSAKQTSKSLFSRSTSTTVSAIHAGN